MHVKRIPKHVPKNPSTFKGSYNRAAKRKPQRWAAISNILTFNTTLDIFRQKRKKMLKQAKKDIGEFVVIKHSIWPRSYSYEYFIHLQEKRN